MNLQHTNDFYILVPQSKKAVKITTLLAQYLYTNHRLELPGIGTFLLDPSTIGHIENNKQKSLVLEGISFEATQVSQAAPELISFISSQSGKMKALASADLDSYLELAKQFLNIGKPFTFEGIGTLVKVKSGLYDFVPDSVSSDKLTPIVSKEAKDILTDEGSKKYESFLTPERKTNNSRKFLIAFLCICGLGLAIWGGYYLSKNKTPDTIATENKTAPFPPPVTVEDQSDTSSTKKDADTIIPNDQPSSSIRQDSYKYVLEITNGTRAAKRHKQLRTNLWDVHLETKDSIQYTLYLILPAIYSDTTRVLDSLSMMTGRRVHIEYNNSK